MELFFYIRISFLSAGEQKVPFPFLFFQFERPPPGFTFAVIASSSTEAYFTENVNPTFKRIGQNMKPYGVKSTEEGVRKVQSG